MAIPFGPAEGQNDSYKIGDAIQATAVFSEPVDVTGTPTLTINVGGTSKTLSYSSGTGSISLMFTGYTVAEGDEDTDGISIDADSVDLNGGTIKASDNAENADLRHSGAAADADRKVDGVRPRMVGSFVHGTFGPLTWSEDLDPLSVPPTSAFSWTVSLGTAPTMDQVWISSDNSISFFLSGSVEPEAHAQLSYTPPTAIEATPIKDLAGNAAAAFTGRTIANVFQQPDSVTGVTVTPGAGSLTVSWNAVKRVDAYEIYWKSGSEEFVYTREERYAFVSGGNTTTYTITNLTPGTTYTLVMRAFRTYALVNGSVEVTGTPLNAAVSTVALTSDPGADGTYVEGDTIEATVTFNGPVDIAGGNPQLEIPVGASHKAFECGAGTAVTKIVCSYTVAANDYDHDGVEIFANRIFANRLSLNGATIRLAGTEHDAVLTHAAVAADAGHKVDTLYPIQLLGAPASIAQTGLSVGLYFNETISVMTPPLGAFTVHVDSVSREVTSIEVDDVNVLLTLASAVAHGETVTVSYADPSEDNDPRALQDLAGNDVPSFTGQSVLNHVPAIALRVPDAPAQPALRVTGPRTIEVDWDTPANNGIDVSGYKVQISPDGIVWTELVANTFSTETFYRDETVHPGSKRYYRVSARNSDGWSAFSPSASAQTWSAAWISQAPASVAEGEEIVIKVTQTRGSRPVPRFRAIGAVRISDSGGVLGHVPLEHRLNGVYWMNFDGDHGTVRLPTRANGRVGEGGTVTLTLRSVDEDVLVGFRRAEPYTVTVTVTDKESPGLRVEDAEANEADGTMDFRVRLEGEYSDPVTVDYATADRTAREGSDYTATSDTLTFAAGETVKTVSVPILADSVADDGERFALTLTGSSGAQIIDGEGLGTIRDTSSPTDGPLTRLMLVDAASGTNLGTIVTGTTLTLPDPQGSYRIEAATSAGATIGRVRFALRGPKSALREDYEAPYELFPGSGQTLPPGFYGLFVEAHPTEGDQSDLLQSFQVHFNVPESQVAAGDALSGLTLTNKSIGGVSMIGDGEGEDGTVFARTEGHRFELAAVVADADVLGSVHLELVRLGKAAATRTDNDAPYELFGGAGKALRAGHYTVQAIAYGNADRGGSVLQILSRSFTLGALTASFEQAPEDHEGNAFTVRLRFSEAVPLSDAGLEAALSVTGGTVTSVRRVDGSAALREIRVKPADNVTEVTLSLAATTDCSAWRAVCMRDGLMLSSEVSHTVPAAITVSVADAAGTEGGTADFVVSLNKASDGTVTVDYETVDYKDSDAATKGADYTAVSDTLTFAAGVTEKTVSVALTAEDPAEADDGEVFWLVLSNASGARLGEHKLGIGGEAVGGYDYPGIARGTIREPPAPSALSVYGHDGREGWSVLRFGVVLAPASTGTVTVAYATEGGTATEGDDYEGRSGTLSFAPGQTLKLVDVPVIDDAVEDSGETVTLKLSGPSGATLAIAADTATILNHEAPALSVAPAQGLESDGALVFEVTLDRAASETVTVSYATLDGTARAGEDYAAKEGVLEFLAGETEQTVTVTVTADEVAEGDETLTLVLTDASGAGIAGAAATGTIREAAANAAPEGLPVVSGTARVGEVLAASVDGVADADGLTGATFAWQWVSNDGTSDTAIEDAVEATYTPVAADVGRTLKVRVTFTDDGGTEETLASAATAPVAAALPEIAVRAVAGHVAEGAAAVFALSRTGDVSDALTVDIEVTAEGVTLDGEAPSQASFKAGARTVEASLATVDDTAPGADGTVALRVAAGPGYQVAGSGAEATVTVLDDDAAPAAAAAEVTLWSATMTVVEYTAESIGADSASLFSNQGGTAGLEGRALWYHAPTRKLLFKLTWLLPDETGMVLHVGDMALAVPVGRAGKESASWTGVDVDWTDGEQVEVRLTTPSAEAVASDASLTSLALGGATLSPAFDADTLVYAASVGSAVESVMVTAAARGGDAVVAFEPEDADGGAPGHQVALGVGETLVTARVMAADGDTVRSYRVVVTRAEALTVAFGASSYTATEGGAAAQVAVSLSADPESAVTIALVATPAGGAEASDYTAPASVTFTPGETLTQIVEVSALADEVTETGESVALSFGDLPDGVVAGTTASATVMLEDADTSPVVATLSVGDAAAQAGRFQVKAAFAEAVTGLGAEGFAALRVGGDAASVSDLAEAETGRAWTAWVAAEEAGRYVVRLGAGAAQSGQRESARAVLVVDVDAEGNAVAVAGPAVSAVTVTPPDSGAWSAGSNVRVTLRFTETVTVDTTGGTPTVGIAVGGNARQAAYASGSGSNALVFAYRVTADDGAVSAVTVTASSLGLGGGTIVDGAGRAADLAHPGAEHTLDLPEEQTPLTAAFSKLPQTHSGANTTLSLQLDFSEEFPLSYTVLQGTVGNAGALTVSGGTLKRVLRVTKGSNRQWTVRIAPAGNGPVTVTLPATSDCTATLAICTADQRALASAVTATVAGPAVTDTDANALTAAFQEVPDAHGGPDSGGFTFQVLFSEAIPTSYVVLREQGAFAVAGGSVERATRVKDENGIGRDDLREIHIAPSGWDAVSVTLPATTSCAATGAICMDDGRMLSNTQTATIEGPVAIDVADATVTEGPGVTLDFVVSLSRASDATVTVDYATADGAATEGDDYTRTEGTLTFEAGQTAKTVSVPVLDDAHDDDGETMTLLLSNPVGARIRDGEATGTIRNSDAMPQAWLARFGRTVAEQSVDAIRERMSADRTPGFRGRLAGEALPDGTGTGGAAGTADTEGTADDPFAIREFTESERLAFLALLAPAIGEDGDDGEDGGAESRAASAEEAMLDTAFEIARETDGGLSLGLWGRAARSGFSGREGGLELDGDATTAMLGTDWTRRDALFGLMLFRSRGEGGYAGPAGEGRIEADLAGLVPWAGRRKDGAPTLWGAAGTGRGGMTLTPGGQDPVDAGLRWSMAAAGAEGAPVTLAALGGASLRWRADALMTRTDSEAADGLAATSAETARLRLGLEAAWERTLASGATLAPRVEVGLRHDGGDAGTGFGIEAGGGVRFADPGHGLTVSVDGRALALHEDRDLKDWGLAVSLEWDPRPETRLGPSVIATRGWGDAPAGGVAALFEPEAIPGADDASGGGSGSLGLEMAWGTDLSGWRRGMTGSAYGRVSGSPDAEDLRLGWRIAPDTGFPTGPGHDFWLDPGLGEGAGIGAGLKWSADRRHVRSSTGIDLGASEEDGLEAGFRLTREW
ncbi:MAG: fibronectin type III domain-containing protein [Boseongicola sp.]|nr:fibronectin type III domain-containing protein [Boseongicola sp.]